MTRYSRVAIFGVGLIGGSVGKALRERRLATEVVGIGRREERLQLARESGAVDRTTTRLADGVCDAELVLVCTPVRTIVEHVLAVSAACPPHTLITDAGSTKSAIVAEIHAASGRRKPGERSFIGSHPLTGDHRTGVEHARADLLDDQTVIVTPTAATPRDAIRRARAFWESLGAAVHLMDPDAHDKMLAASSHAPHLVAAALAAATPESVLPFTAGGWRDSTRIAAGDPGLWRDIVASNPAHIDEALDRVQAALAEIREAIARADFDRLEQILTRAKRTRDALGS